MTESSFSAAPHRIPSSAAGIVQFMGQDLFANPPAEQQLGIEKVDQWHEVQAVGRRGDLYLIEASLPALRLKLRFSPGQPANGDYEIHPTRGGVERGRTQTVKATAIHVSDLRFSRLAKFPVRYELVTVASESPHEKKVWIVGFHEPPAEEATEA